MPAPPAPVAPPVIPQVAVAVDHSHKAKGAFGSAFKGTMGCLMAIGVVMFIGCVTTGVILFTGAAATVGAVEEVQKARERARQQLAEREAASGGASVPEVELDQSEDQEADVISGISITGARVEKPEGFSIAKNILVFSVTNDSDQPIERLYVDVVIKRPGRAVDIASGSINFSIPDGLEPGEKQEFRLEPNAFSGELATNAAPSDAVLTMTITRADWPGKRE